MIGFIGRLQLCADQQRGFTAPIAYSGRLALSCLDGVSADQGLFCGIAFDRGCGHVFGLLMRVMSARWP
jgi:hypothetical protein